MPSPTKVKLVGSGTTASVTVTPGKPVSGTKAAPAPPGTVANTPGPSTSDLVKLVKSYRAKVSDIDVRWTYIHETLASDPAGRKSDPIPKIVEHIRQRGPLYVEDSLSWRTGREEPLHFVLAYDGEKQTIHDVDNRIAHISPADDNRARLVNWMYQVLKWPQQPERSPYGDLVRLLESDRMTILPEKETVYGVQTVVLDYDGWEKIWLTFSTADHSPERDRRSAGSPLARAPRSRKYMTSTVSSAGTDRQDGLCQ
jgi:hypothetical protein